MSLARPPRIDAHQHFWRYDAAEYDWIDERMRVLKRDFLPDELQAEMRAVGFDGCVAVQARQTPEETRFLLELAGRHPFVLGVVGWVDLQAEDVEAQLARVARDPKLVGVRHIAQSEPDDRFLLRPAFCRGIALLERFSLAYDILIYPRQLKAAAELVGRFPGVRFVLDHAAKAEIRAGVLEGWERDLRALAALPNVWCKASGLVTEADWERWRPQELTPVLDVVFDCFSAERVLIGSDWPVCTLAASYARTMGVVTSYLESRSERERAQVLGGNACRLWKLSAQEAPA